MAPMAPLASSLPSGVRLSAGKSVWPKKCDVQLIQEKNVEGSLSAIPRTV
jgi:hypothetical protein